MSSMTTLRFPIAPLAGLAALLLAACSAPPRAEIGPLTVDNRLDRPVALAATWYDAEQDLHGRLEVLLPANGAEALVRESTVLPAGTTIVFATHGEGYDALLARNGVLAEDLLPMAYESASAHIRAASSAHLILSLGSTPHEGGELTPAELQWSYPGGAAQIEVVVGEDGGLRLSERPLRR